MSYTSVRQLNAFWVLGWALVKHIFARPFIGRRRPEPWLRRLASESLGVVPPMAWDLFAGSSRCIGCGLCDLVGEVGESPSRWILSFARQPADALIGLAQAERLETMAGAIESICPARVQVRALARLVRENARMLGD